MLNSKDPLLFSKNKTRIIPSNKKFSFFFTRPYFLRTVLLSPTMSKLSNDSPQYESHYQSQDDILIIVIQNERRFREWARKIGDLDPRFEKI